MAIHFENGLILLNIHKNATTWMRSICQERFGKIVDETKILKLSELEDGKVFAFVRNPWDRILSGYLYGKKNWRRKEDTQLVSQFDQYGKYPDFDRYLRSLKNDEKRWQIFKPQVNYLDDDLDKLFFLGRFENIEDDMDKLCDKANVERFDLDLTRQHYTKSGNKSRPFRGKDRDALDYRKYYNEETKEIVADFYADDIKIFNYEF